MNSNSPVKMKKAGKLSNPAKNEILNSFNDDLLKDYIREISEKTAEKAKPDLQKTRTTRKTVKK